jgi:hypothetical protein
VSRLEEDPVDRSGQDLSIDSCWQRLPTIWGTPFRSTISSLLSPRPSFAGATVLRLLPRVSRRRFAVLFTIAPVDSQEASERAWESTPMRTRYPREIQIKIKPCGASTNKDGNASHASQTPNHNGKLQESARCCDRCAARSKSGRCNRWSHAMGHRNSR